MKKNHLQNDDKTHYDLLGQAINAHQLQLSESNQTRNHRHYFEQCQKDQPLQFDEQFRLFEDKDYQNKIINSQAFRNRYSKILKLKKVQEKQEMVSYKQLCAFYEASLKRQSFQLSFSQIGFIAKIASIEVLIIDHNFFIQNYVKPFIQIYQELNLKTQQEAKNKIIQIIYDVIQFGRQKFLSRTYKRKKALTHLEALAGWYYEAKGNHQDHSIRISILTGLIKQVFFVLFVQNLLNPKNFLKFIEKEPEFLKERNQNRQKYQNRLLYCLRAIIPQRFQISTKESYKCTCQNLKKIIDMKNAGSFQLLKKTHGHIKNKTYEIKGYQKSKKKDFHQDYQFKDFQKQGLQNIIRKKKIQKQQANKCKKNKKKRQKRKVQKQNFKRVRSTQNQPFQQILKDKKSKKIKTNQVNYQSNNVRRMRNIDFVNNSVSTSQCQEFQQNQPKQPNVLLQKEYQMKQISKSQEHICQGTQFQSKIKNQSYQKTQKKIKKRTKKQIKINFLTKKKMNRFSSKLIQQGSNVQLSQIQKDEQELDNFLQDSHQYYLGLSIKYNKMSQLFSQKDQEQILNFIPITND